MLTARSNIAGPLPKLAPLMIREMRALGCEVSTADWSHRREHESVLVKTFVRTADLWRVRRLLRTGQFDVMLVTTTHDRRALLRDIPLMALRRGRCARVLHFHGSMVDELHAPGRRLFKACTRWLVGRSDAVLVLSEEERRKWQAFCPAARFEVVVNPFEPAQSGADRAQGQHAPPGLLFVGRLIREKGIFDLLEAMPAVVADQPCVLRIAGQGPCEAELRARVDELGLGRCVQVLGYVEGEALAKLYAASDVLVLPTYFGEGFPTVIAEAMSHGLAIVTTPIRGAADHLRDGENALFVAPREPGQVAAALSRLLNDSALRADMGERNSERVKAFAPGAVVPRYVEIMEGVVRNLSQPPPATSCAYVLQTRVDLVDVSSAAGLITHWAKAPQGRMVCAMNVHMIMEAFDDPSFRAMVNDADLVVADGRPVAWACRLLGHRDWAQVRGEDLTLALCEAARREHLNVGLYGGAPATLDAVRDALVGRGVTVTYACSPPFRPLTPAEEAADLAAIRDAGVQLLLVGLGCPKQERWMARHRGALSCTMVGVGAVFEMLAGQYQAAPVWVQRIGLEWAYRIVQEPRRLWRRYALHNTRFVLRFAEQWLAHWQRRPPAATAGELVAYEAPPVPDPIEQVGE